MIPSSAVTQAKVSGLGNPDSIAPIATPDVIGAILPVTQDVIGSNGKPLLPITQDVIGTFVLCDGLSSLTLEILNKQHHAICPQKDLCTLPEHRTGFPKLYREQDLIEELSQNLSRLQDLTRAKALIETYKTAMMFLNALPGRQSNMDGYEMSKTTTTLLQRLEELTNRKNPEHTQNVNTVIFDSLHPEARQAWLYLQGQASQAPSSQASQNHIIEQEE